MKRTITRLISIVLVMVLCLFMLPLEAFAWGKMTHVYTANYILNGDKVSVAYSAVAEDVEKVFQYNIPDEYLDAMEAYPDAFRAGALGPDMYPDILTGQMYIHPKDAYVDSGEWITYLCDSVNKMGKDTPGRQMAMAFTLGCILHYCGDLFGHDFVNTFSGGTFPSVANWEMLDIKSERLNNVLSHLSVEAYMDDSLYPTYIGGDIDAPNSFVQNTMVFNGTPAAGLAPIYAYYPALELQDIDTGDIFIVSDLLEDIMDGLFDNGTNNVPPHYTAMLALRVYVKGKADGYRDNMEVISAGLTRFYDEWAEDIDVGMAAFTAACDNIARRMVTGEKNPDIEKKKKEEVEEENNFFVNQIHKELQEEALKSGITQEQLDQIEEQSTLGILGNSLVDEVLRELIRDGVVTQEMLTENDGAITIIREELGYWWDEYGIYMLCIPDIVIDGIEIPVIGDIIDLILLGPLWDLIKQEIKKLAADWIVSACVGWVSNATGMAEEAVGPTITGVISAMDDRLEDPQLQLDHEDNPFKPSENNFADLKAYMDLLPEPGDLSSDTEFEALYNTITMFQLVLMGPENYSKFIKATSGATQTSYQKNTAQVEATSLKFAIRTSDLFWSGTNDNIYVNVYRLAEGKRVLYTRQLLDISGEDDFEAGDTREYLVELPGSVKLSELEIGLSKTPAFDFLPSLTDDWCCENIEVQPAHSGYGVIDVVDLGGVKLQGICEGIGMNFATALKAGREPENQKTQIVTTLNVDIKVRDVMWAGSDSDIYLAAYNGDELWAKVCFDKAWYNDLERNDHDLYRIPVTAVKANAEGIPLDKLSVKIIHDGIDQANWEKVTITPCYGSLPLTSSVSVGGVIFENNTWATGFSKGLKQATYKQYEPFEIEYETLLDDGLLSYMASLDGGEEWVDDENELWTNTSMRKDVFFKIFHGFSPEIEYTGNAKALQIDPVDLIFNLDGVWNGVSNDRRGKVKDLEHVYLVDGTMKIELHNEKGELAYTASDVDAANGVAYHRIEADTLEPGYYDMTVYYYPDEENPLYAQAMTTYKKALQIIAAERFEIKQQPKNATVDMGNRAVFTVEVAGGLTPYTYSWEFYDAGDWHRIADRKMVYTGQGTNKLTVLAKYDTPRRFRCTVTDSSGKSLTSNAANLTMIGELSVMIENGETLITYDIQEGVTRALAANVTGGVGPYTYTWYTRETWKNAPWKEAGSGPEYKLEPSLRNDFYLKVVVKDSSGKEAESYELSIWVRGVIVN